MTHNSGGKKPERIGNDNVTTDVGRESAHYILEVVSRVQIWAPNLERFRTFLLR